jgi:hypothetical protein
VPLIHSESDEEIYSKLEQLNGVVMPGGNADYLELGQKILTKVLEFNDNG